MMHGAYSVKLLNIIYCWTVWTSKWFDWFWSNFIKEVLTQLCLIDLNFIQILATWLVLPINLIRKHCNRANVPELSTSAYIPKEHNRSTAMTHTSFVWKKIYFREFHLFKYHIWKFYKYSNYIFRTASIFRKSGPHSLCYGVSDSRQILSECWQNRIQYTTWRMSTYSYNFMHNFTCVSF